MAPDDINVSIPVKDIMAKALISVNPATTAFQIAKMMEQGGIGAVLVKENGNLVGIVTDRDFATKIAANNLPLETPVQKIMSSPLVTINHDEPITLTPKFHEEIASTPFLMNSMCTSSETGFAAQL